jgi:hypothetical protein
VAGALRLDARLRGLDHAPRLDLLIDNETDVALACGLDFGGTLGGWVRPTAEPISLAARDAKTVAFPLMGLPTPDNRKIVVAVRGDRETTHHAFDLRTVPAARIASAGDLAKVKAAPFDPAAIRQGSGNRMTPADLTPTFRAGYDDASLHVEVEVADDSFSFAEGRIVDGRNDQVHVQIAADTAKRRGSAAARERFGRAASAEDATLVAAAAKGGALLAELRRPPRPPQAVAGGRFEATPTGYRVRLAVPWSSLDMAAPRPGDSLVFNVVVFDADGVNADHKVEWPWAGNAEYLYDDPAGWGEIVFQE